MDYGYLMDGHRLWWHDEIKDKDIHEPLIDLVGRLQNDQKYVEKDNLDHLRLYVKRAYTQDGDGNIKIAGCDARIGINGVKSAIDTVCARITTQKPRVMFVTEGGRWDMRRKAKKLQKFVDGVFHEQQYYKHAARAFKDCAIFGTGFLKFYFDDGKVKCERIYPGEVLVDEQSCQSTCPNSMFQVKFIPVESLIAKFPDQEQDIVNSNIRHNTVSASGVITTLVRVVEAWHLPQHGTGGRHAIIIDGATLFCETWKHEFFPIIPIRWNEIPVGYYGNGAAEDLHGIQEEIDYMMGRIQNAMHVAATPTLFVPNTAKVPDSHFTNRICSIVHYSGDQAPTIATPPAMHQQVFDHLKWLHELIFDDTGVSQMSATSRKPKGVESGIALQTLLDVESQRFQLVLEAWEQLALDGAERTIALAKQHYRGGQSEYAVKFDDGRYVESIKWADVNMAADEYILKKWPTNLLPSQPAGKIEVVERMIQGGMIDAQTGFMLLDFPDTESYQSLALSALRNALWIVDQVIYEDNFIKPRIWHDLQLGMRHMQMGLSNAELEGAPEEVLERGNQWLADANDLLNPPQPPQPQPEIDPMTGMEIPPEMGGGMAPADPMAGLPPAAPVGGPAANIGNVAPAGVIVPGTGQG